MKLSPKTKIPIGVLLLSLVLLAAMILTRPEAKSTRAVSPPPTVEVIRVSAAPAQLRVAAQGTVEPRTESDLVTEVAGRVVWVSPQLASGGYFEAGEALARIDPRDSEIALDGALARVRRAESDLLHATKTLERHESMRQTGASSRSRLDDAVHAKSTAEANLREAQVSVRRAKLDLERSEIAAPFAGRVREKHVGVGQFVGRGTPVARLYSVDYAEVRLPIADSDLAYLDLDLDGRSEPRLVSELPTASEFSRPVEETPPKGVEVLLTARYAGERHTWRGYVVRTEGALDRRTRMLNVVARIDDPHGRTHAQGMRRPALPIGLFVDASIAGRHVEDLFEIPRAALRRGNEVLVVDDESRLRVRRVGVLRTEQDLCWISEGLSNGERIVISSVDVMTEGMKVRISERPADPPSAAVARHRRQHFQKRAS